MKSNCGTLYGVGVGPGDPALLTLKAARIIETSPIVSYIVNQHGDSRARDIAKAHLNQGQREIPMLIPMQLNRLAAQDCYQRFTSEFAGILRDNQSIAVLCEGDPLFFGSFIYLYQHMAAAFNCEIIAGINSIQAAAAISKVPICFQTDRFSVVTARNTDAEILAALINYPCVAILKVGKARPRLLDLLHQSERWHHTCYIENATLENQVVYQRLDQVPTTPGPYFSLFLTTS